MDRVREEADGKHMKIPHTLKIGIHSFKIELVPDSELSDNDCGAICRDTNTIFISAELHPDQQFVTLFHEIFHGMNSELDETLVESLAQQLCQVLRDNDLLKT